MRAFACEPMIPPAPPAYRCLGCDAALAGVDEGVLPFGCPRARPGDDIDHVVVRSDRGAAEPPTDGDPNPFVAYRRRLSWWRLGASHGLDDGELVEMARMLDEAVARVEGGGFRVTPFRRCPHLSAHLRAASDGGVWVKDETGNVSGSHKGRHLFGVLLFLRVLSRLREQQRLPTPAGRALADRLETSTFAIASCGNAALAAAVLARAADLRLRVFVPPAAPAPVLRRLAGLGADVVTCPRRGDERGDPCYLRFHEAVAAGAVPFCVQGPDNGLAIEGGQTIAWEMRDALGGIALQRVFVQVGGGALATAMVRGFGVGASTRASTPGPRIHAVQTAGAFPVVRAHARVVERVAGEAGWPVSGDRDTDSEAYAAFAGVADVMREARRHRSSFMWPWETPPRSVAEGILDDETYDWAAVVEGMLESGGWPLVVAEETLEAACALVRDQTRIDADHTGAAGVAGLLTLARVLGRTSLGSERVAVIVSGRRRS